MLSRSRSPDDGRWVTGKILIENLPKISISPEDVNNWLKKYGNISDIIIYTHCMVIQFDSDLEAAGAVQCENGAHFYGSAVSVRHVELSDAKMLRRMGPPVDRFSSGSGRSSVRYRDREYDRDKTYERDRDRERYHSRDRNNDHDRDRNRDRGHERSRDRDDNRDQDYDQDRRSANRDRHRTGDDSYESRRKRDDHSPQHPPRSPLLLETLDTSAPKPPPYTAAIIATEHDLVPYAVIIEQRVTAILKRHDLPPSSTLALPRTHIVVLLSMDHLTPCLADLTKDNVPFAIICTKTNWTHGSCTLRILYASTQQEHRNMPLEDAVTLFTKEYESYISSVVPPSTVPIVTKSNTTPPITVTHPTPIPLAITSSSSSGTSMTTPNNFNRKLPPPNSHQSSLDFSSTEDSSKFLAPSRHISTLLRMLADSRILSIGELDEIAQFVQERKMRLQDQHGSHASGENSAELKSRILSMLYPATSTTSSSNNLPQPVPPPQHSQPQSLSRGSPTATLGSKLAKNLSNPVVQQAIDNILSYPSNTLGQLPAFGASYQAPGQFGDRPNLHAGPSNNSNSNNTNIPLIRPQRYGSKSEFPSTRKMDNMNGKSNNPNIQIPPHWNSGDSLMDSKKHQNYKNQNYSEVTDQLYDPERCDPHSNQTNYEHNPPITYNENRGTGWPRRKRGQGGSGAPNSAAKRHQSPSLIGPAPVPPNLMSTEVNPVGAIAKAYNYGTDPFNSTVPPPAPPSNLMYNTNSRSYPNPSSFNATAAGYSYPPPPPPHAQGNPSSQTSSTYPSYPPNPQYY